MGLDTASRDAPLTVEIKRDGSQAFEALLAMAASWPMPTGPATARPARRTPNLPPGIAVVSRDGHTVFVNDELCAMLGCSPHEVQSVPMSRFIVRSQAGTGEAEGFRVWVFRRRDGIEFGALVEFAPVHDPAGHTVCLRLSVDKLEQTSASAQRSELGGMSDLDRDGTSHLERLITEALGRADGVAEQVGLLRLDVDGFDLLRERHGETVAAVIGRTLVQRMCAILPLDATIGQFTGGEYGVLLDGWSKDQLTYLATEVLREIVRPTRVGDVELLLTLSVGISISQSSSTTDGLVNEAGEALTRARRRGGDRFEIFDDTMRNRSLDNAAFASDLQSAIAHRQLDVSYQPIVTTAGRLVSVEALVRWTHPTRGAVPPGQIIEVAEESGLIHELGRLVLARACSDVARWRVHQPDLMVSVNLSGMQLVRTNIASDVERTLAEAGLDPSALTLEITESVLMEDPAAAMASLSQLSSRGIRIVVDDFGTGYSSLLYIRRFALHGLKLDRLFVVDIDTNPQSKDIVGFVLDLARSLKLTAVAEGVETKAQMDALAAIGCDLHQGYYWSKSQPAERIDAMVENGGDLVGADFFEPSNYPASDEDAGAKSPVVSEPAPVTGFTRRVLLVDDSAGQRSLTRAALESSGRYVVIAEADNADAGVAMSKEHSPDLVMLDLAMPGRNGLEVIPEILAASPGTQVVVSSGYVSTGSATLARSMGAAGCLGKYLPGEGLIHELDAIL